VTTTETYVCKRHGVTEAYVYTNKLGYTCTSCPDCRRESTLRSYHRNKERKRAANRLWAQRNRDKKNASQRLAHDKRKAAVLAAYGGRCACPGCTETHSAFLCIDHINGDGASHRKIIGPGNQIYRWLYANNFPEGFQVLCANCNMAKGTGSIDRCPHNTVRD
jgi:hypothetical protein